MSEEPNENGDETDFEHMQQQLIHELKEKGPEDPETFKLLNEWITLQQNLADQYPDRKEGAIQFSLNIARLYTSAGYKEAALENYNDAKEIAWQCHKDRLHKEIKDEISKIKF